MYFIGFDLGSSSVKACLVEAETGKTIASAFYPSTEMAISAPYPGSAEQDPAQWWENACQASLAVMQQARIEPQQVKAVGIAYQMHGLVVVDRAMNVLRPSIIWCDSRAVSIGTKAFESLGKERALAHLLNSPGNFTASKLAWVKEHEPDVYAQVYKMMLPGDYLAVKMTGEVATTESGLSEGVLWDFLENAPAEMLLRYYGFDNTLLAQRVPTFGIQGLLTKEAAVALGLAEGTPVSYRAGDQPNNAFSLNVLEPGEVAATAGTSGVVYGISDVAKFDNQSRVNTFLHVNHQLETPRYGVLLCINGTGILNSWIKNTLTLGALSYQQMNELASPVRIGSDGLICLPFGNGAERMLENKNPGASFAGLDLSRHTLGHWIRAGQEGIVFSFYYGMQIMEQLGVPLSTIRAGEANMFLSPVFRETFANLSQAVVELYNTDGAQGAARGAGLGIGYYKNRAETFHGLTTTHTIEPDHQKTVATREAYELWRKQFDQVIDNFK